LVRETKTKQKERKTKIINNSKKVHKKETIDEFPKKFFKDAYSQTNIETKRKKQILKLVSKPQLFNVKLMVLTRQS
jgi:hypothetical protein